MTKGAYIINQLSDKPPQRKSKERLWAVLIACSVAAFGPFSFGYCMGYSSAAVTQLGNPNRTDVLLDKNGIRLFGVRCYIRFVILFILNCIRRPCRVRLNFAVNSIQTGMAIPISERLETFFSNSLSMGSFLVECLSSK